MRRGLASVACGAPGWALLGLLLSGCIVAAAEAQRRDGKPAPKPKAKQFQISGVVVSAVDQEPVQRAVVEIAYTSDLSQRRQTVTGEDGRFAFPDLAAGKYSLAAAARGFRLQAFNQHEQFSSAVAVGEGQSSKNLTFRIEPDGGIQGRATDDYDEPVLAGEVLLFYEGTVDGRGGTHFATQTQTDG